MSPKKTLAAYIATVVGGFALQILSLRFFPLAFDAFGWWAIPASVMLAMGAIAVRSEPRMRSLAEYGGIGGFGVAVALFAVGHFDIAYYTVGQMLPILVIGSIIAISAAGAGIAGMREQPTY